MRMSTCSMSTELYVACSRLSDSGEDAKVKTFFPCAKFTRQVLCSFLRAPMCGKSRKHSFNTEVIVDFSISHAWTPHAIFLSDRKDPHWECWYNLSNLTNQRVHQELVYRNGSFKEMITGSAASSPLSFLPFYFRLHAPSIQQAQLSRSLGQAKGTGKTYQKRRTTTTTMTTIPPRLFGWIDVLPISC